MFVLDQVLADPEAYRQRVLARPFADVEVSPGVVFRGIQPDDDAVLPEWIVLCFPQLEWTFSFFRQSPAGQREPHYIHTDRDMGDWTAVLYLNPQPAPGDGTRFWRHRLTGATASVATDPVELEAEARTYRDASQWALVEQVDAMFGRLVLFPAAAFHSRAILDNYGTGTEARLIQVVFGTGVVPETPAIAPDLSLAIEVGRLAAG